MAPRINGPVELREALMRKPEIFVGTVTEKLMIYALGRGLSAHDMPAIRRIVRNAGDQRLSLLATDPRSREQRPVPAARETPRQHLANRATMRETLEPANDLPDPTGDFPQANPTGHRRIASRCRSSMPWFRPRSAQTAAIPPKAIRRRVRPARRAPRPLDSEAGRRRASRCRPFWNRWPPIAIT